MTNSNIVPLTAAGGVLYKAGSFPKEVLLIKRKGFWDLPKGKLEKGESIEECAVREVEEEIGAKNLSIEEFLCDTYHEYQQNGKKFGKTTYWYSMRWDQQSDEFVPQIEEGITNLKWVVIEEAKRMAGFENLVKVLNKFG